MKNLLLPLATIFLFSACGPQLGIHKISDLDYAGSVSEEAATASFRTVVFDVGEGNSTMLISPNNTAILIDAGPKTSFIKKIGPFVESQGIALNDIFITHPDNDHSGGLEESGYTETVYKAGDIFELDGGIKIEVVAKDCLFKDGETIPCDADNEKSGVFLVTFNNFSLLITGDLPGGGGEGEFATKDLETLAGELVGDIDVLIVGHHGSNTSTNENLIKETTPEAAIISLGNNNNFWHPHKSTIERLISYGIGIYQTNRGSLPDELLDNVNIKNGDIVIETDGNGFEIK